MDDLILQRKISKITNARLQPPVSEWEDGFNTGLEWALRLLNGDKSAD